jgi:SAM-dependent methyltransferase
MTTTDTDATTAPTPPAGPDIDPAEVEAFFGQLMGLYTGSMLTYMIDLGHRTGLLTAAAAGPATSEQLARRAGLHERYVREWIGAMVTGGILELDAATAECWLPPARAVALTGGPMSMAPIAQLQTHLGKHVGEVARAFREGGGVPYSAYRPEFTDVMDAVSRTIYDSTLVDGCLPLVPGLVERLRAGARLADVACGTGHALVVLAREFPASTFVGYDLDEGAIARARAEATGARLGNVTYEVRDAARLIVDEPFDAVVVFDALHDQVDPTGVLARIHDALVPGGWFLMKEPHAADDIAGNVGNPFAPMLYATSVLHCMTVSLAHDGAGIGTAFGEQLARDLLAGAGFRDVVVHEAPGDPLDAIYVAHRE